MTENLVSIVQATKDDAAFVFSSWLKSFRTSEWAESIPNTLYYKEHHRVVENILSRSHVLAAKNPEDESQIMGWMCVEMIGQTPVIHYIYVKYPFRKLGIARLLLSKLPRVDVLHSHRTQAFEYLKLKSTYSPYLLFKEATK